MVPEKKKKKKDPADKECYSILLKLPNNDIIQYPYNCYATVCRILHPESLYQMAHPNSLHQMAPRQQTEFMFKGLFWQIINAPQQQSGY